MKRLLILFLIFLLTFQLGACSYGQNGIIEPVEFFYQCRSTSDSIPKSVISSEIREATGHTSDLNYLLSLYMQGPLDPELQSPFPAGCSLLSVTQNGDTLMVLLDATIMKADQIQQTITCACIARTCLSLTDVAQVQIKAAVPESANSLDMIITRDNLLLEDAANNPTEENP